MDVLFKTRLILKNNFKDICTLFFSLKIMYQTTVGIFLNNNLFKLLYIAKFSSDTGIFIIHDMEGGATDALFKSI